MKRFGIIASVLLPLLITDSLAQVPQIINYQGRIAVGGTNFDGTGQFSFALVNPDGSLIYWSNGVNAVSLTVTKGLYSVLLGDTTVPNMTSGIPSTVFTNTDVRLRVWFDDGAHGSQQLSPDQRIAAVGYAFMAGNVPDTSITSAKLADGAVTGSKIAPNAIDIAKLSFTPLTTEVDPKVAVTTIDAVPKWNGTALVNGTIYDNGNIGIGTTNPVAKLDVGGGLSINGTNVISAQGQWVGSPTGLQGPQGPAGPTGPQGPQGPSGPSVVPMSSLKTLSSDATITHSTSWQTVNGLTDSFSSNETALVTVYLNVVMVYGTTSKYFVIELCTVTPVQAGQTVSVRCSDYVDTTNWVHFLTGLFVGGSLVTQRDYNTLWSGFAGSYTIKAGSDMRSILFPQ